jgi:uncharacterized protein YjbI with pentapeptide repeats
MILEMAGGSLHHRNFAIYCDCRLKYHAIEADASGTFFMVSSVCSGSEVGTDMVGADLVGADLVGADVGAGTDLVGAGVGAGAGADVGEIDAG